MKFTPEKKRLMTEITEPSSLICYLYSVQCFHDVHFVFYKKVLNTIKTKLLLRRRHIRKKQSLSLFLFPVLTTRGGANEKMPWLEPQHD